MKRKFFYIIETFILICGFLFILSNYSFAADPTLVNNLTSAFVKLKGYIVKIATSFVAVAVATGLLMRKFSLGDEKKIYKANGIIKGSLISYVLLLSIDGILSLVDTALGV